MFLLLLIMQGPFKTAKAKSYKRVSFVVLFFRDKIHFCWQQHKTRIKRYKAAPLTWDEFKTFL